MLESITKDVSFRKQCKIVVPLFGAAYILHQIKAPQFYTDLGLQKKVLNPLANG